MLTGHHIAYAKCNHRYMSKIGIDFTISNLETGCRTFNCKSLHSYDLAEGIKNPYQKVIEIMGKTLECFDMDGRIPAFGFGDSSTKDRKIFPFSVSNHDIVLFCSSQQYN